MPLKLALHKLTRPFSSSGKASSIQSDKFYNIIDGQNKTSTQTHNAINPRTKQKLWDIPIATESDVNDAVKAAEKAFQDWRLTTLSHHQNLMKKYIKLWNQHHTEMTDLLMAENGKARTLAIAEVDSVTAWWDYYSKITFPSEESSDDQKVLRTIYKPLGVAVGISPWNFPLALSMPSSRGVRLSSSPRRLRRIPPPRALNSRSRFS